VPVFFLKSIDASGPFGAKQHSAVPSLNMTTNNLVATNPTRKAISSTVQRAAHNIEKLFLSIMSDPVHADPFHVFVDSYVNRDTV
jgi:hypothetical protein